MCNIWQTEDAEDLDVALLKRLPASLKYVNLSGGEPFLRKDLPELVAAVNQASPQAKIIISTNALLPGKRIRELMSLIRQKDDRVGLAISIDGMGETHDRIRGVPGAFDKAVETIKGVKEDGMTNLRIAFTVVDENVKDYFAVYRLSRELGIEFTSAIAQGSSHYFRNTRFSPVDPDDLKEQLNLVMASELGTSTPKRWARAYFNRGLYLFARGGGRPLSCRAADDFFFLNPEGTVYPCNVLDMPLGSLRESTFEEIWNSEKAIEGRKQVHACGMGCWMVCTARSSMKRNPLKVASWIAAGKTKVALKKPVL
jgi:radical SAM protein with 4Fe4S-binding SPASM domain